MNSFPYKIKIFDTNEFPVSSLFVYEICIWDWISHFRVILTYLFIEGFGLVLAVISLDLLRWTSYIHPMATRVVYLVQLDKFMYL